MAVSKRLRFEILRRDNHTCRYCGRSAPEVPLRVDHIVPVALGGTDGPENLVAACHDCNSGKSSVPAGAPLTDDVTADAFRWSRAMQQAAAELSAEAEALEGICRVVYEAWRPFWIPSDYRNSVYNFVKAGLTQRDLVELVDVAHGARGIDDRWAYFCGCGWKRLKQRQARASEILARDEAQPVEQPLTTVWTVAEIEQYQLDAIEHAKACFGADFIERITRPPCQHGVPGHCGDPVCAVEDAHGLTWLTINTEKELEREDRRAEALVREAEALLDG